MMNKYKPKPDAAGEDGQAPETAGRGEMHWIVKTLLVILCVAVLLLAAWLFLKNILPLVLVLLQKFLPYLA